MIQIELYGRPVPWSTPGGSGKVRYNPRAAEKEQTRWQIKSQYRQIPIQGAVALFFKFWFAIPPKTSSIRKHQMLNGIIIPQHCDVTNLQKFYEDCLKDIVITDDRYTAEVKSSKRYAEKPGVLITIYSWDEYRGLAANENYL